MGAGVGEAHRRVRVRFVFEPPAEDEGGEDQALVGESLALGILQDHLAGTVPAGGVAQGVEQGRAAGVGVEGRAHRRGIRVGVRLS